MKIAVVGAGYVGLSLATLLGQKNEVIVLDILPEKVDMINSRISPIKDREIEEYFRAKKLNLEATMNYEEAFKGAEFIIICTPTNYDEIQGYFDTTSVESIIKKIVDLDLDTTIVVKSTIPVGFIDNIRIKYDINNIFFSPEFLREGKALYDNLYPSRIIIGDSSDKAVEFADLLKDSCLKKDVPIKYMGTKEAESVKLFANTYLALRISFFNELDTYAGEKGLNARDIIDGICLDLRIGNFYNNPSFGYGGYCLPKDTKQLLANYKDVPQNLIGATINSNSTRKDYIVKTILQKEPKVVGVYKLTMKKDSDNFRESAIIGIINGLKNNDVEIIIYEPSVDIDNLLNSKIENDLDRFIKISDIILVNRLDEDIKQAGNKIYTRDIFNRD